MYLNIMINNLNQPANYAQNFKDIWASNHQSFAEPQRNFKYHNSLVIKKAFIL